MVIVAFDVLGALNLMFVFFVLFRKKTNGQINSYLIVPTTLIWVHVVGNGLQETHHGPKWVQDHLHDLGVATFALTYGYMYFSLRRKNLWNMTYDATMTKTIMRFVVGCHLVGTLACVAYKVSQVTIFREQSLAEGYSGKLDFGDVSMFLVGVVIVLTNHFVMRGRVLRKRDTYIGALETRNGLGHA